MDDKKHKVLLAEDDPNLGEILREYLEVKGFDTMLCKDGEAAWNTFQTEGPFDICVFDVMMPKMDGFSLGKNVREKDQKIPMIFLTAKSMKEDTLKGFELGADDYITKPFSMEELIARVKAILKRSSGVGNKGLDENIQQFKVGKFSFDSSIQRLSIEGDTEEQKLTSKESALLRLLCLHKNDVLDRSYALKEIWFDDNYFNSRSMDVYITKLRKHLKKDPNLQIINVHGQGFKLVELNQ